MLLLALVDLQPSHCASMLHDLGLQCVITDASDRGIDHVSRRIVAIEHSECAVQNVLDWGVVIGCCVQLGTIVSPGECESAYHVRISCHMDLDVSGWCWHSMFVGDGEGDEVLSNVVDEPFGWFDWRCCLSCCCMSVSWGGRWPY